MRNLVVAVKRLAAGDEGQDLVEYGLLASLIATFMVGALTMVGESVNGLWGAISDLRF